MFDIARHVVRYGDLKPCRTAFIDAHTPGSDRKENFTIVGAGVSEAADQHVHVRETPGFNIGAAGQPPKCRNSLHSHRTAEVFFVLKGRWRFFWGRWGTAGEVVLEEGDIFNIPTGIFRGFENVGTDYGMIMSILGGDDAGGGVVWAPQVLEEARAHGLTLGENGRLYDAAKGETLPPGVRPMPALSAAELEAFPETPVERVVGGPGDRTPGRPARPSGLRGRVPDPRLDPADRLHPRAARGADGDARPLAPRLGRRRDRSRPRRHLHPAPRLRACAGPVDDRRVQPLPRRRHRRSPRSDRPAALRKTS
jgi:quercetin dioxygenase-like cupin family protein